MGEPCDGTTLCLLGAALAIILAGCIYGFSIADVEAAKRDIKAKFESQGFTVTEVSLIRESDYKLTGFASMQKKAVRAAKASKELCCNNG